MNLTPIASNMTEVTLKSGAVVLFSYSTPVAVHVVDGGEWKFYYTEKYWSRTTSRHISKWLPKDKAQTQPQEYFDNLVKEVA